MSLGASERREIIRWTASAIVVVLVHAGAAAALISWEPGEPAAPAAALVIDLAPIAAAPPAPEMDVAPGPEQEQTETPPETPIETAEVPPEPEPEPPPPEPEPEPPPPEVKPAPKPEVAIAPPKKQEQPKPKPKPKVKQATAPKPSQRLAEAAAAPTQAAPMISNSNAIPNWRSRLVAHLERHKRYPSEAQARRETGTAQLAFSVDRSGNVTSARLVRSSGSAALDAETLAMVRRASPVPAPPPEMGGSISLSVPVRFNMR